MGEIKNDLLVIRHGESYVNDTGDDAYLISEAHTHLDILRYVVADIGWEDALFYIESLKP